MTEREPVESPWGRQRITKGIPEITGFLFFFWFMTIVKFREKIKSYFRNLQRTVSKNAGIDRDCP